MSVDVAILQLYVVQRRYLRERERERERECVCVCVDNSDSLSHKSLNGRQKLKPRSTSKPRCNFGSQTPNRGSFCSFFVPPALLRAFFCSLVDAVVCFENHASWSPRPRSRSPGISDWFYRAKQDARAKTLCDSGARLENSRKENVARAFLDTRFGDRCVERDVAN